MSGFIRSFRNFFLYIEDKSLMKEKIAFVLLEMKMMWFKQKFLEWNLKWCFLDLKGFFKKKKNPFILKYT